MSGRRFQLGAPPRDGGLIGAAPVLGELYDTLEEKSLQFQADTLGRATEKQLVVPAGQTGPDFPVDTFGRSELAIRRRVGIEQHKAARIAD